MENKALGSVGLTAALERINNLLQEKATKTELENYTTLTKINQILGDYVKTTDYTIGMNNKVDKVSGKGLSTNDYTTAEKNKLATLENYDDSALVEQVSQLEQNINTVIGEGATEAIENFKEILDFLAGITDTETLQGLIANLKINLENKIAEKANKSHIHRADDITSGTLSADRIADGSITTDKIADGSITDSKLASGFDFLSEINSNGLYVCAGIHMWNKNTSGYLDVITVDDIPVINVNIYKIFIIYQVYNSSSETSTSAKVSINIGTQKHVLKYFYSTYKTHKTLFVAAMRKANETEWTFIDESKG